MELKIQNLNKAFGKNHVLKDIQLEIGDISNIAIIGPSGGGKTTLLRIIAGLETADAGELFIDEVNQLTNDERHLQKLRSEKGFVFQAHSLFSHMTVIENIIFPLVKLQHKSKEEAKKTAVELLERFGLCEHKDKLPDQLSGGQQQRVAIVRAIALDTKLMLFDEPTSALDPILTEEVLTMIAELGNLGKEFIIVTHAIGFARDFSDYILYIDQGKILEHGRDIIRNPQTDELKYFLSKVTKF
ncbi:MAG: amino acid ABC transporter ATP-binding protein [Culicoidibacterales bacterium]